jgi:hypothetical protein
VLRRQEVASLERSCHVCAARPHAPGRFLEIFARKNNLRDFWVSIGNEVGVGLPDSDLAALRDGGGVPGARWGRGAGGGGG